MKKSLKPLLWILILIMSISLVAVFSSGGGCKPMAPPEEEPTVEELIEEELEKLSPGKILFNVPQEMKVGENERIEVRITKTTAEDLSEDLSEGLKGRGLPQIEEIRVNSLMGVRLSGDDFDIKALSHEDQIVTGEGFTQWSWDVIPLKSGMRSLLLTVTIRIKIPGYGEEKKDYPVFEREIKVKVNIIYTIEKFIKDHWQWIITVIIIPIVGWLLKKLWEYIKKKKKRKSRV